MKPPLGWDRRRVLLGGLAGLALPALAAGRPVPRIGAVQEESGPSGPSTWGVQVVLVRHAEKQTGEDPELTEAGHSMARGLASLLSAAPVSYLEHSPFRRTQQTLAPLAVAHALAPRVTDPRDVEALRDRLHALPDGAVAVVAGHSNTLPQAVRALGGSIDGLNEKGHIEDPVFNRMFVLSLRRREDHPVSTSCLELRLP